MKKTVAIAQSNYIPWKGYFDLINSADELILYDDMQYNRRAWRNRNVIKASHGLMWLTIPVQVKGKYTQKIKDTCIADANWGRDHWRTISHNYSKAKYISEYGPLFEELYSTSETYLSRINYLFMSAICRLLGIKTTISWSMDYELKGDKTEMLMNLCKQAGATGYVSGPAAKVYLNEGVFHKENISVSYMDYSGYPEYQQLYPPYESEVSIIDLIFNEGPDAQKYMKSFATDPQSSNWKSSSSEISVITSQDAV